MRRLFVVISLVSIINITVIANNSAEYLSEIDRIGKVDSVVLFSENNPLNNITIGGPLARYTTSSYPTDPTADIPWSCEYSGVDSIQCAFNNARTTENSQLGTTLPLLTLPSQTDWDSISDAEKAMWLINRERIDRNVPPLDNIEDNVSDVAQTYADFLLDHDAWGHEADGRTPWERLEENPAIGSCYDFLPVAENLTVLASTEAITIPVERAVYFWIYGDSDFAWGHRHVVLWSSYNDNSGLTGMEGFMGLGRTSGGPYQGPFSEPWPVAEMIVLNVFDPCSSWAEDDRDGDGIPHLQDNCPNNPNGPNKGTCTLTKPENQIVSTGQVCTVDANCDPGEFCEKVQADTYPPGGNGIGDACDCEANFNCDLDVDGAELTAFLADFGRGGYSIPCDNSTPCNGDFVCDGDVDGADLTKFLEDFGRGQYDRPCPICNGSPWCSY